MTAQRYPAALRLLAHELAHVVQQAHDAERHCHDKPAGGLRWARRQ
ncbi:MAG: DUF4157 domain-containing protein [Acidobacteriaceae bacterium]|nr:DUF4157 domain-containing protein [Acidobacteriaceae bacterium]MBV8591997.1 DUF4157 domain-containing protein [Acetobacteraceae bacterium]